MRLRKRIQHAEMKSAYQQRVCTFSAIQNQCLCQLLQGWTWLTRLVYPFLLLTLLWSVATLNSFCFLYQLLSDGESVRWLNHAVKKMWPICMEKIVSQLLRPIIPWFLDKFKPWIVVCFISSCYFIYVLSTNVLHSWWCSIAWLLT